MKYHFDLSKLKILKYINKEIDIYLEVVEYIVVLSNLSK